jgi:CubicO group peptidase (beta-lactamase class C family)
VKTTIVGQIVLILIIILSGAHPSFGQVKALNGETITTEKLDRFIRTKMDSLKLPGLSVAVINDGKIFNIYKKKNFRNLIEVTFIIV